MIARAGIVLLLVSLLSACTAQAALSLFNALIPDGTTQALLSNFEKVQDQNLRRVLELEAAGRWEELAKFAEENVEKDRANADWWFVLGVARTRLKQYDAAATAFSESTRLEPDNMNAWNWLGQSYRAGGDSRSAINALNRALNIKRGVPTTLYLLGESYSDLLRYGDAVVAYEDAVTSAPDYAAAWFSLSRTYTKLGRAEDAREARGKLEKLNPKLAAELTP